MFITLFPRDVLFNFILLVGLLFRESRFFFVFISDDEKLKKDLQFRIRIMRIFLLLRAADFVET